MHQNYKLLCTNDKSRRNERGSVQELWDGTGHWAWPLEARRRFICIIGKLAANFYLHFHSVAVCRIIVIEKHTYVISPSGKKIVEIQYLDSSSVAGASKEGPVGP